MSGPIGSVNPRNDAFAGGSLKRAAPPTSVSGQFTGVGAPGFPNPGIPAIASARNNRGSNVTIPYARVVPLHGKDALLVEDDRFTLTGKTTHEYSGLESGELAWVLGKQFPISDSTYSTTIVQHAALASMPVSFGGTGGGIFEAGHDPMSNMGNLDMGPVGYGVDRLQRLAYTNWLEAYFKARLGRQVVDLKGFDCKDETTRTLSSTLNYWDKKGFTLTDMFAMPDIAYALQTISGGQTKLQVQTPMVQGIFVMERGPFLRSIGTDHRPVEIKLAVEKGEMLVGDDIVDRHLGSQLAQSALEACLKKNGVFNWTPDGICMSKYETGPDGFADAEFEARMSQLYNVAVQGSAITKTWTGDHKLVCMPTDKVFMLVVADLAYSTTDTPDDTTNGAAALTKKMAEALHTLNKASKIYSSNAPPRKDIEEIIKAASTIKTAVSTDGNAAMTAAFQAWVGQDGMAWDTGALKSGNPPGAGFRDGIRAYEQAIAERLPHQTVESYKTRASFLWDEFQNAAGKAETPLDSPLTDGGFDEHAAALRNGKRSVKTASLSNFRLMRSTSSHMTMHSHYRTADGKAVPGSRLGLPIGYNKDTKKGTASYVVGGWCIGTVLDSAASRTVSGSVVRVSASSMAININVNVEWWNADKLYQHYQDKERYTKPTSVMTAALESANPNSTINKTDVEIEALTDTAKAKNDRPAGTIAQRDVLREAPSRVYSLDLDTEAFDDLERYTYPSSGLKKYSRGWEAAGAPAAPVGGGGGSGGSGGGPSGGGGGG